MLGDPLYLGTPQDSLGKVVALLDMYDRIGCFFKMEVSSNDCMSQITIIISYVKQRFSKIMVISHDSLSL